MVEENFDILLREQLASLPKKVQDAIVSTDIEKHLQELSKIHRLHLDQWELLEKEVLITLLGLEKPSQLALNIERNVGVPHDEAVPLAEDISRIVFAPIRSELESMTGWEVGASPAVTSEPALSQPIVTVTPNETYGQEASHERKDVSGDPYREQP